MIEYHISFCLTHDFTNATLWGENNNVSRPLQFGKIIIKSRFQFCESVYNE
jgi:hypothetical protein